MSLDNLSALFFTALPRMAKAAESLESAEASAAGEGDEEEAE